MIHVTTTDSDIPPNTGTEKTTLLSMASIRLFTRLSVSLPPFFRHYTELKDNNVNRHLQTCPVDCLIFRFLARFVKTNFHFFAKWTPFNR